MDTFVSLRIQGDQGVPVWSIYTYTLDLIRGLVDGHRGRMIALISSAKAAWLSFRKRKRGQSRLRTFRLAP